MKITKAHFFVQRSFKRPKGAAERGTKKIYFSLDSTVTPEEPLSLVQKTSMTEEKRLVNNYLTLSLADKLKRERRPKDPPWVKKCREIREERRLAARNSTEKRVSCKTMTFHSNPKPKERSNMLVSDKEMLLKKLRSIRQDMEDCEVSRALVTISRLIFSIAAITFNRRTRSPLMQLTEITILGSRTVAVPDRRMEFVKCEVSLTSKVTNSSLEEVKTELRAEVVRQLDNTIPDLLAYGEDD